MQLNPEHAVLQMSSNGLNRFKLRDHYSWTAGASNCLSFTWFDAVPWVVKWTNLWTVPRTNYPSVIRKFIQQILIACSPFWIQFGWSQANCKLMPQYLRMISDWIFYLMRAVWVKRIHHWWGNPIQNKGISFAPLRSWRWVLPITSLPSCWKNWPIVLKVQMGS